MEIISIEDVDNSNTLVSEEAVTGDQLIFEDFPQNAEDIQIVNMSDAVVLDPANLTLKDLLLTPPPPEREGSKTTEKRTFIISSKEWQEDEKEKADKKAAVEAAKEARKIQRAENKLKRIELFEELKKQKVEKATLRKFTTANDKKLLAVAKKSKQALSKKNKDEGQNTHSVVEEEEKQSNEDIQFLSNQKVHMVLEQGMDIVSEQVMVNSEQVMNMVIEQELNMVGELGIDILCKKRVDKTTEKVDKKTASFKKKTMAVNKKYQRVVSKMSMKKGKVQISTNKTASISKAEDKSINIKDSATSTARSICSKKKSSMQEQNSNDVPCLLCLEQITNGIVGITCWICNQLCHLSCAIKDFKNVRPSEFTCQACINQIIF